MEPNQTFIDDPLRILRTVRFATRFGYKIDYKIIKSAQNQNIKVILITIRKHLQQK